MNMKKELNAEQQSTVEVTQGALLRQELDVLCDPDLQPSFHFLLDGEPVVDLEYHRD